MVEYLVLDGLVHRDRRSLGDVEVSINRFYQVTLCFLLKHNCVEALLPQFRSV
jgi:hypothetical protein